MGIYRPLGGSVTQELEQVSRAMSEPNDMLLLEMRYVAPAKPRDGMVVLADGVNFNPSAGGQGFYGYYGGSWKKLG